jgi:hypothetical protein
VASGKKPTKKVEKPKKPSTERAASAAHGYSVDKRNGTAAMDRRAGADRRGLTDRRKRDEPVAGERRKLQRRAKVNRRRQIDPTTCERDYTGDEIEFMSALDDYKRRSGRMFPTCSEVLEVIRSLGYEKHPPEASADEQTDAAAAG